jgi:hypothetical protein
MPGTSPGVSNLVIVRCGLTGRAQVGFRFGGGGAEIDLRVGRRRHSEAGLHPLPQAAHFLGRLATERVFGDGKAGAERVLLVVAHAFR